MIDKINLNYYYLGAPVRTIKCVPRHSQMKAVKYIARCVFLLQL